MPSSNLERCQQTILILVNSRHSDEVVLGNFLVVESNLLNTSTVNYITNSVLCANSNLTCSSSSELTFSECTLDKSRLVTERISRVSKHSTSSDSTALGNSQSKFTGSLTSNSLAVCIHSSSVDCTIREQREELERINLCLNRKSTL